MRLALCWVLLALAADGCGDNLRPSVPDAAAPADAGPRLDGGAGDAAVLDAPVADDAAVADDATGDAAVADDATADSTAAADTAASLLPFGANCTDNAECESGVCYQFGTGQWCTLTCSSNNDCPSGSQGKKCNQQGYCRP